MIRHKEQIFHKLHLLSFVISIQAYLYSTYINSAAAKLGLSFTGIGLINFFLSIAYAVASITLGHLGTKVGYKKMISILSAYLFFVSIIGFTADSPGRLVLFAILQGVFFGAFFPQVEGLIAKSERLLNIDPPSITGRFTLSWSTGNIIGVAFGPFLTVKAPPVIFTMGLIVSSLTSVLIYIDYKKQKDIIIFPPSKKLLEHSQNAAVVMNKQAMRRLRLEYRIILFLGGLIYTSVLASFPKLMMLERLRLENAGFLTVGANIGVLLTFVVLQSWKGWVGNELVCGLLLSVAPLTGLIAFFAKTPVMFFITALFAGLSYAVPYTFAIFYGLLSEEEDHGKQGALHEMVIGLLFGIGPLVGGLLFDKLGGNLGLLVYALSIGVVIYTVHYIFNSLNKKQS
ncbi:Major Facilitator Superfamily protein [Fervidobacterium changbaicum]|uniref:MFS transporter n=1 Tax=Fervidobacterium changbaicum TaxID=310769 RepID=A0AAE5XCX0_9BACT|nr:MFS transporter [Fervidobacterium changbaicum]QAV33875.1 MFS transporter [Fervidobacterium changbaicum]SDH83663.1 Major Facilitator Superfamily protein [Fervidobacterium changbaicum]